MPNVMAKFQRIFLSVVDMHYTCWLGKTFVIFHKCSSQLSSGQDDSFTAEKMTE